MVDKSITIKSASDEQLRELMIRLRQEKEVQDLIGSLKRAGTPSAESVYTEYAVSTEIPVEDLYHEGVEAILAHHGIKGMRWGVRKAKDQTSTSKKSQKKYHSDYEQSRAYKKQGYKNLSNKELQELTQRMNLERNLRDLESSDYQRGLSFVKTITAAGTTIVSLYALSKTPLAQDIKKALANR